MWGTRLLKSWSTMQSTLALSSGEADLYALPKAATQVKGLISMAMDFGEIISGATRTDSTAAMGIVHRTGIGGRTRHVNLQYLWIQSESRTGGLGLKKVGSDENVADLMSKFLKHEVVQEHIHAMSIRVVTGRAKAAGRTFPVREGDQ